MTTLFTNNTDIILNIYTIHTGIILFIIYTGISFFLLSKPLPMKVKIVGGHARG